MNTFRLILLFALTLNNLVATELSTSLNTPIEGQHYTKVVKSPEIKTLNQLTFYFWPGSESSYQLELALQQWQPSHPTVTIERLPLVKRPGWRLLSKVWLTAEKLQLGTEFIDALYLALHVDNLSIDNEQQLLQFIDAQSIDRVEFMSSFHSLDINQKLKSIEKSASNLPISGVPTILINGRWLTDASMAKTSGDILTVIELLLLQ